MSNRPFPAAYSGQNSLYDGAQLRETWSMTGFLGAKLFNGSELYFNPEPFQGFGLSRTHGVGAFPNNEAQKAGYYYPHYYTARLFLRHVFGLGGEQELLPDGPNQVESKVDVSRVTVTFGKFAIPDIFDNNTYAHDARTTFMNYALVDGGAFDYAGDQKGYSWGAAVELNQKDWALRAGYFLTPDVSNSNNYDTRLFSRGQYLLELERRWEIAARPLRLRLTGWDNQCYCGSYSATLAQSFAKLQQHRPECARHRSDPENQIGIRFYRQPRARDHRRSRPVHARELAEWSNRNHAVRRHRQKLVDWRRPEGLRLGTTCRSGRRRQESSAAFQAIIRHS